MVGKTWRTKVHLIEKNKLFCGRPLYENGSRKFFTSGNGLTTENQFWCPECAKVAQERNIKLLTFKEWWAKEKKLYGLK